MKMSEQECGYRLGHVWYPGDQGCRYCGAPPPFWMKFAGIGPSEHVPNIPANPIDHSKEIDNA
jgi:hypothetical protein